MAEPEIGKLYVLATPIGNLEDITLRALRILREVEYIAAEDTRTTRKLLSAHGIHTRVVSYQEHGNRRRLEQIIDHIREGMSVALVSEAGTPVLSDPGYDLIQAAISAGIDPVPIPGPSVLLAALSISGLPLSRFGFEGFLPRRREQRKRALEKLKTDSRTLVFFESPRRLRDTLEDLLEIFGDRRAALARELTKAFEECRRHRLSELLIWAEAAEVRGEITLVVEGGSEEDFPMRRLHDRIQSLRALTKLTDREIIRIIQDETNLPRKIIYGALLNQKHHDRADKSEPEYMP
jgi:16S rRNA (cytidine1402-2'-O)-methyltransferase